MNPENNENRPGAAEEPQYEEFSADGQAYNAETVVYAEPVAEPVAEAVAEPVFAEPVVEAVAEPVTEAVAEPVFAEPVVEAVAEPVAEFVAEPVAEAVAEPVAEFVAEAVAEPVYAYPEQQNAPLQEQNDSCNNGYPADNNGYAVAEANSAPKKKSRALPAIIVAIAAVLIIGGLCFFGWSELDKKDSQLKQKDTDSKKRLQS